MRLKKVLIVFCFIIMDLFFLSNTLLADTNPLTELENGMSGVSSLTTMTKAENVFNIVIGLIQIAGTGVSIITVTLLGIKYMLASSEDKAEIKKMAVPVVTGAVILFAAVNLVAIIADVGSSLN